MQYEERQGLTQARYDGTTIYEWNIDGQTEYQILNLLQEMTMASNAYKTRNSNEEKIVKVLISGFTGSLKGWWDNYVTDIEKAIICSAKKTIVKVENNVQVQTQEDDMVNTLIYAILKNFIGNPHTYQERNSSILLNLTCRKLSDFRWYKDVFMTKVTTRPDCKEAYWKERFIAGLPRSQIMKIMINDESDISDYEEDDLNILEDESTSDNESEVCECVGNCTCDYKEINTINEDKQYEINTIDKDDDEITSLIDLVDKIKDPNTRKIYYDKLKEKLGKTKVIEENNSFFSQLEVKLQWVYLPSTKTNTPVIKY
ncbi:hypothetical protein Tco_0084705 [Tanacetum coccineum]